MSRTRNGMEVARGRELLITCVLICWIVQIWGADVETLRDTKHTKDGIRASQLLWGYCGVSICFSAK